MTSRNRADVIPSHYKGFAVGEKVILSVRHVWPATAAAPVWGSRFGYLIGTIKKVKTGLHDKTKHTCEVCFPSIASTTELPHTSLEPASSAHLFVASQWDKGESVLPVTGVYIMVREAGQFYLGFLDYNAAPHRGEPYHLGLSCQPLIDPAQSDYNLVNLFLSQEDFLSVTSLAPAMALEMYRKENGFPLHTGLMFVDPTSIPRFQSIQEAAESIPPEEKRDGVILFSTPTHLHDVVDLGPPAAHEDAESRPTPEEIDEEAAALVRTASEDISHRDFGGPDELDEAVARFPQSRDI